MKIRAPQIPDAQMHQPRRRLREQDPVGKIRVLCHDDQLALARELPYRCILQAGTQRLHMHHRLRRREADALGQILVEEKPLHAVWSSVK
jgi:hypothetical protein